MSRPGPSSRRAVLSGAVASALAIPAVTSAQAADGAEFEELNRLWRQWLILRLQGNRAESDEETNRICDDWHDTELAIEALPPSLMRAAAVLLVTLHWNCVGLDRAPADLDRAESEGWQIVHVLPCLRPHLTGDIARAVDRILAQPHVPSEKMMDGLAQELGQA